MRPDPTPSLHLHECSLVQASISFPDSLLAPLTLQSILPTASGGIRPGPRSDHEPPTTLSKLPGLPTPSEEKPSPSSPHPTPAPTSRTSFPQLPLTHLFQLLWTRFICFSSKNSCSTEQTLSLPELPVKKILGYDTGFTSLQRQFGSFSDECCLFP